MVANPHIQRKAPVHGLPRESSKQRPLLIIQCPHFAGGAADENTVNALCDQALHVLVYSPFVYCHAVLAEGCDNRNDNATDSCSIDHALFRFLRRGPYGFHKVAAM